MSLNELLSKALVKFIVQTPGKMRRILPLSERVSGAGPLKCSPFFQRRLHQGGEHDVTLQRGLGPAAIARFLQAAKTIAPR